MIKHYSPIHSRLAKRGRLSTTQYRVSLSLFAYQYVIALDKAVSSLNKNDSDDVTADEVDEVRSSNWLCNILKKLRRKYPLMKKPQNATMPI